MVLSSRFSLTDLTRRYDQGQMRFEHLDLTHLALNDVKIPFLDLVDATCNASTSPIPT